MNRRFFLKRTSFIASGMLFFPNIIFSNEKNNNFSFTGIEKFEAIITKAKNQH